MCEKVEKIIMEDSQVIVSRLLIMLAYELAHNMKFFSYFYCVKHETAKWIPKLLNFQQK